MYESEGALAFVKLKLFAPPVEAWFVDAHERRLPDAREVRIEGDVVAFEASAFSSTAVCLRFE